MRNSCACWQEALGRLLCAEVIRDGARFPNAAENKARLPRRVAMLLATCNPEPERDEVSCSLFVGLSGFVACWL